MTFRQFALLILRVQTLWLLFYAAVDLTYLPRYLSRWFEGTSYSTVSGELKRELALAVLRIALHVVAALAVIQYAERLLSWLVKDWVGNPPPNPSLGPTSAAGSLQGEPRKVINPIIGAALAIVFLEAPLGLAQVPYVTNLDSAFSIARQESRIVALYTGRSVFCQGKSPREFFFDFILKKHPEFGTRANRFVICEQFMGCA